ncbi:hypothetical protein [Myxococcus fulvus]|nr:hypothetical protein [Myxococcus fulvus]
MRVHDATGRFVSNDSLFADAQGLVWSVDLETGRSKPVFQDISRYFETSDCTGEAFMAGTIPPRYVFTVAGDPTFRRRPDTQLRVLREFKSYFSDGRCRTTQGESQGLPLSNTAPDSPISLPTHTDGFTPPFHYEFD